MMEILQYLDLFDWVFEAILFVMFIILYLKHRILLQRLRIYTEEEIDLMTDKERRARIIDLFSDALLQWVKDNPGKVLGEEDLAEHLSNRIKSDNMKEKQDG